MSPKQLAKCCLYYKEEVLDVIVVINWSGLWGRSWLCWGLTGCRRWRSTSPSLWRRRLREGEGEKEQEVSREQSLSSSLTHLPQGLNSHPSDNAQPPPPLQHPPLYGHLSSWIFGFISIPVPVVLGLLSRFFYFTHCLLIIIWYFFTIAPYSSCSLWHQPGTTLTPEELLSVPAQWPTAWSQMGAGIFQLPFPLPCCWLNSSAWLIQPRRGELCSHPGFFTSL